MHIPMFAKEKGKIIIKISAVNSLRKFVAPSILFIINIFNTTASSAIASSSSYIQQVVVVSFKLIQNVNHLIKTPEDTKRKKRKNKREKKVLSIKAKHA